MKIGFQTSAYNGLTLLQELTFAKEHGADFFDVFFDGFMPWDITDEEFALIKSMSADGFGFSVHLPINIDKCSAAELAELAGFVKIVKPVTTTVHFDKLNWNLLEKLVAGFSSCTRLCIENTIPDQNPALSCDYFSFMVQACKNYPVAATFDTGHCNVNLFARGKSSRGNIAGFAQKLIENGVLIATVHNHDNFGTKDEHKYIGAGNINFEGFYKVLKNAGQTPLLVIEHWGDNEKSFNALKNLVQFA